MADLEDNEDSPAWIATGDMLHALMFLMLIICFGFALDSLAKSVGDWFPMFIIFVVVAPWLWMYFYCKAKKAKP